MCVCIYISITVAGRARSWHIGLIKQPGHLTQLTGTNLWQLDLTPPVVDSRSQPSKTNSSKLSGGFPPLKAKPLNSTDKNLKRGQIYLDPATIRPSFAQIQPHLALLRSNLGMFAHILSNPTKIYSTQIYSFTYIRACMLRSAQIWRYFAQIQWRSTLPTIAPSSVST